MAEKTKPVSLRDTELSSGVDIARRFAFLACIVSFVIGGILLLVGQTQKNLSFGITGLSLLAVASLLFAFRRKIGLSKVKAELEENPFKPTRVPKE